MPKVVNFYLDDSGTRHPSHDPGKRPAHGYDWFAFGGVLIKDEDEEEARRLHAEFCQRWNITYPLHSSEIRAKSLNFRWLISLEEQEQQRFYEELYQLMRAVPVVGIACVVDRPGYNGRYFEMYQKQPWLLCKTAFAVSVERAAKYSRSLEYRLRVCPERCNKAEDRTVTEYYSELKQKGMPFAPANSAKYAPLTATELAGTLYELDFKSKSSPMAQLADLYLWPIAMAGYKPDVRPYVRLKQDGKLMECFLKEEDWPNLGTKYSCFDKR